MDGRCGKCGGPTYTTKWGDAPPTRVTYCKGCNKQPLHCKCKKKPKTD